jgi:hypothetical protein
MVTNQSPATMIPTSLAIDPRLAVDILSSEGIKNIRIREAKKVIFRTAMRQVQDSRDRKIES